MRRGVLRYFFILFFLVVAPSSLRAQAQQQSCSTKLDSITQEILYTAVDEEAHPEGGLLTISREIIGKLNGLSIDPKADVNGKVWVAFVIDQNGKVKGKRVIKDSNNPRMASQVLSLVENIKWVPATCQGTPVATLYILPMAVCFR